jgi:hypothetical protein
MRIRLTRKLSQRLNGVDISRRHVGDVLDLPRRDAELLLAEGWAMPEPDDGDVAMDPSVRADDAPRRRRTRRA